MCLVPGVSFNANGANNTTGHLQVRPLVVNPGNTVKLYWNVANVASCTVNGTNDDYWSGTTSGVSGTSSAPIDGRTTYSLHCSALSGGFPPSINESVTVGVTPRWREL